MPNLPLTAYSNDPVYNMKAVTQRTGIPAATLRAWERRYHVLAPLRTQGNYRLYSDRDVATLRWLKDQIEAGLSISRAVVLLERLRDQTSAEEASSGTGASERRGAMIAANGKSPASVPNWEQLLHDLDTALMTLNEQDASLILAEAFALYSVEDICTQLIAPAMVRVGDEWLQGNVSVVQEHFATTYLNGRLLSLFNAQRSGRGPLILVGCAPTERHEMGALMLALFLRRAGHDVRYLGADIPLVEWVRAVKELHPHVVAISAMLAQASDQLDELPHALETSGVAVHLVYGGHAFAGAEEEKPRAHVEYIGTDIVETMHYIEDLLRYDLDKALPV